MNKKTYEILEVLLLILFTLFVFLLGVITLISASIDDIKVVTCISLSLSEPNCTTWWDSLNLTDLNFTEIIVEYKTEDYNYHYDYSNKTYYDNDTYVYYNQSYNQTYLDSRYALKTQLNTYVKKSEVNNTNTITNTITEVEKEGFTWWNVITLIFGVLVLGIMVFLFFIVREINSMSVKEEE